MKTCWLFNLTIMKEFWNKRFSENESVYGIGPNAFFKSFIDHYPAGEILLPAEGEGRNGLYAASKGWKVSAFDFSSEARAKALQRATTSNLHINYELLDLAEFRAGKQYDAVGLIYIHLPEDLRRTFHQQVYESIQPGGFLVLEGFAKEQLQFNSGGPKDAGWLYDIPTLKQDFPYLHLISCEQKELILNEGPFHQGPAAVVRIIGQKVA